MGKVLGKYEIKELFKNTRPDEDADPRKYLEFGYLEYSRYAIEVYVRDALNMQDFSIEIIPSNKITDNRNFDAYWLSEKQCIQIFFKARENERCYERISIAEALGLIVLSFVPERLGKAGLLFEGGYPSIAYFAQKLLILSANRDNGSFLRKQYTLTADNIAHKLIEFHSKDIVNLLDNSQKSQIGAEVDKIFTNNPVQYVVNGLLSSDIGLIMRYIQRKESYSADNIQQKLMIYTRANQEATNLTGKLYCYEGGCNIWYPAIERIQDVRIFNRAAEINALAAVRLIIAHELGHIVCHRIPGYVGRIGVRSTPEEEREATYFARLLLEHREFLYSGMIRDEKYDNVCSEIKKLIRQVYRGRDEEWMNWVLSD